MGYSLCVFKWVILQLLNKQLRIWLKKGNSYIRHFYSLSKMHIFRNMLLYCIFTPMNRLYPRLTNLTTKKYSNLMLNKHKWSSNKPDVKSYQRSFWRPFELFMMLKVHYSINRQNEWISGTSMKLILNYFRLNRLKYIG